MDNNKYREFQNYQAQVLPYQDPETKAVFLDAVYTLGEFSLDNTGKRVFWSFAVWASVDSFEQGGKPLALVKRYLLTDSTGLTFDAVMERFPEIKTAVGAALLTLTAELDAGIHNVVETVEDAVELE